ncbi:MAG: hypothetical protein KAQ83_03100 [Nanoarchaeota archaeon]|nr:hypothetical protein [Nanoarchaeota archaeon]
MAQYKKNKEKGLKQTKKLEKKKVVSKKDLRKDDKKFNGLIKKMKGFFEKK